MRIKVKRVRGGSIGDQRDYGLVTGSIWNYEDKPSTNNVSTTMTPEKDRENATIEAERGETVVGDLDNDGQLEHAKIGGKRHFEGGTPLNVPDGSFVFSDYNGLLIKNKELLANVFNYKSGKSATPAKVARRYELDKYKNLLNDPNADFLDQKTAQLMIDNNLKKLGQLALVQESMKGFPDGIPNIALPLFGSDMQAGGSMPKMKKGGLVKAQKGMQKNSAYQTKYPAAQTKHPAANNPLYYDNGMIYESAPRTNPNLLSDLALAATNPFATLMSTGYRGGDWRDYVAEHSDNPIDFSLRTTAGVLTGAYPFSAARSLYTAPNLYTAPAISRNVFNAATVYDMLPFLIQEEYGGQYMQTAGQKQSEPGFFESLFSTPGRAIASGTALALAGYPTLNLIGQGINKGYGYISKLPWYQGKPAVNEVVPMINDKTKRPYSKAEILTKKGTPKASAIKEGKAVVLEVESAVKPILGPRTQQVVKTVINALPKKYRIPAYAALAAAGGIGGYFLGDYLKEQDPSGAPTLSVDEGTLPTSAAQTAADQAVLDNLNAAPQRQPVTTVDQVIEAEEEEEPVPATRSRRTPQTSGRSDSADYWGGAGYKMPADTSEAFRRGGMPLPKAQQGDFVIQDPDFLQYRQDYDIMRPEYYPGWASVGSQMPGADSDFVRGADYEILPTRGIANPKTGKKYSGIQDFINYANPYINFEDYDTETNDPVKGMAQWKKDQSSRNEADRERAGKWMIDRVNLYNQIVSGNPNLITIDPNKKGAWELGSENLNVQFLRKKQKQPAAPATPSAPIAGGKEEETGPDYTGRGFEGVRRPPMPPWWKGDVAGFLAATGQIVPGYLTNTVRMTPSLMEPAYTEFDPSAYMGAYTTALQNMGTGPQGRGAALSATGAAGKTYESLNRERQANRMANLQTYLQAQSANMQALNQANLYNTEEQKDYINRINTVREATARDLNKKSAQIAEAYGKGLKNVLKTQNINAMFPYQYSDMNMGTAVNPTLQSLYDEPITGYGSSGSNFGASYKAIYDLMIANGADPKEAAVEAARAARASSQRTGTAGAATSMFDFLG